MSVTAVYFTGLSQNVNRTVHCSYTTPNTQTTRHMQQLHKCVNSLNNIHKSQTNYEQTRMSLISVSQSIIRIDKNNIVHVWQHNLGGGHNCIMLPSVFRIQNIAAKLLQTLPGAQSERLTTSFPSFNTQCMVLAYVIGSRAIPNSRNE